MSVWPPYRITLLLWVRPSLRPSGLHIALHYCCGYVRLASISHYTIVVGTSVCTSVWPPYSITLLWVRPSGLHIALHYCCGYVRLYVRLAFISHYTIVVGMSVCTSVWPPYRITLLLWVRPSVRPSGLHIALHYCCGYVRLYVRLASISHYTIVVGTSVCTSVWPPYRITLLLWVRPSGLHIALHYCCGYVRLYVRLASISHYTIVVGTSVCTSVWPPYRITLLLWVRPSVRPSGLHIALHYCCGYVRLASI